jgi:hypothetical protein
MKSRLVTTSPVIVAVLVIVDVIGPVIVAVHVNGNANVIVIDTVIDRADGPGDRPR